MNLTRCENGHFYDAERFDSCPHCNQTSVSTVAYDDNGDSLYTVPLGMTESIIPETQPLSQTISEITQAETDGQATIGVFGDLPTDPVVGWLVAVEGSNFGQDFKLKTGRNFIGRSANMDVALTEDSTVSREKHAIILYEPKGNIFLVQPGDAKELFYLNDRVVLTATEINAYDILNVGNTKLLFVPCCSDKFTWDSVKPADK